MSIKNDRPKFLVLNAIMDCGKQFHGLHKLVLCRLVSYGTYNKQTDVIENIFPSIETLVEDLGISKNTIKAAIKAASNLKILRSEPGYTEKGKQSSNLVTIYVSETLQKLKVKKVKKQLVDKCVDNSVDKAVQENFGGQPLGGLGGQPLTIWGSTIAPNKNREQINLKDHYVKSEKIKSLYKNTEEHIVDYINLTLDGFGYTGNELTKYTDEVLFHAHTRNLKETKSFDHAVNAALKIIKSGNWSTPKAMLKMYNN